MYNIFEKCSDIKIFLQEQVPEFHSTTLLYMVFSSTLFAKASERFINNERLLLKVHSSKNKEKKVST